MEPASSTHTPWPEPPSPSDPELSVAEVLGTRVTFTDEGPRDGTPLLLVHGVPGGVRDFRYLAPTLSDVLRVVRLELPGFGDNDATGWRDWSPRGRATLVAGFADALGIGRFGVLGHSMGGPAALAAAAAWPDRIAALVLVASVGVSRHRGMPADPRLLTAARVAMRVVPGFGARVLPRIREQYERMRFPGAEELTLDTAAHHLRTIERIRWGDNRRAARAVRCPTLVAWAADDALVEPAIGRELAAAIRPATAVAYPSGGHNIQKTRAEDLGARIVALVGGA